MLNTAAMDRNPPGVDRLSLLSDEIICDILSFLPTKDAAVTPRLSKRYRYLLPMVPVIDLDLGVFWNGRFWVAGQRRFPDFINKMLSSKERINKFRIQNTSLEQFPRMDLSLFNSWILGAIKRKVQMLDIGRYVIGNDPRNLGFLPNEIFNCKTLVSLKLFITGPIDVGEHVDLPNLKELSLSFAKDIDAERFTKSLHDLLPGCPMLEDLGLQCQISTNSVHAVYISVPSLKRLRLDLGCERLIVDSPNLLYFECVFMVDKKIKIEMKNPDSLVSAQLTILDAERLTEDLSSSIVGISGVKSLSLKMYGRLVAGCSFPEFPMVKYLELHGVTYDFHESLSVILDSTPAVEFLVMDMDYKQCDGKKLNTPIAMCLSQSVKEVEYRNFSGSQNDFERVKYILKYGKALTRMTIRLSEELHPSVCKLIALIMSSHICPKDGVYIKRKKIPSSDEQGIACIIIQVARP